MPKWIITTQATVERVYEVEAATEKEAISASCERGLLSETDINEETIAVVPSLDQTDKPT